jgi:RNA recognition motif-containing protein
MSFQFFKELYSIFNFSIFRWLPLFQTFGTVNFVKLVFDKSGKSKGYGFLYMNDRASDAAVEDFSRSNNNRITLLNKSGVFLARHDRNRQNPIRNPKKPNDDRMPADRASAHQNSVKQFSHPSHEYHSHEPSWNHAPLSGVGAPPPALTAPHYSQDLRPAQPREYDYSYQYAPAPPAPHVQNSPHHVQNSPYGPPVAYGGGSMQMQSRPPPLHHVESFPRSTKVFLENLPLTSTPDDICNSLFQYSLHVIQCQMEYDNDPKASWCYCHIEFSSPEEATRCIALAQQSLLEYRGRILTASEDSHFQPPPPVPVSHAPSPPSNYPASIPQYGPPVSNHPPHSEYPLNSRNTENRGRPGGRGRGQNRRNNRRHRPY